MSLGPLDLYGTFAQSTTPFLFCCSVLPSATRVEQIHLRHVFISGETTEDLERSDTKNAQKGKKRFDRRAGEEDGPFFRDLRERGRGEIDFPHTLFMGQGVQPLLCQLPALWCF